MHYTSHAFERLANYRHRALLAEAEKARHTDQLRLPHNLASRRTVALALAAGVVLIVLAAARMAAQVSGALGA